MTHHENAAHAAKIAAARDMIDRAAATQRKLAAIERVTGVAFVRPTLEMPAWKKALLDHYSAKGNSSC